MSGAVPALAGLPQTRQRAETSAGDASLRLAVSASLRASSTNSNNSNSHSNTSSSSSTPLPAPGVERDRAGGTSQDGTPTEAVTPCTAYFTAGRCRRGDACPFLHQVDGASPEASPFSSPEVSPRERSTSAPPSFSRRGEAALRRLPVFTWPGPKADRNSGSSGSGSKRGEEEEDHVCLICYEPFGARPITALPCIHKFHAQCVFPWVKKQGTCPKCFITVGGERRLQGNDSLCVRGRGVEVQRARNGRFVMSTGGQHPNRLDSPKGLNKLSEVLFGPHGGGVAWVPDNCAGDTCMVCPNRWGKGRRRHHCRACGLVACSECLRKCPLKGIQRTALFVLNIRTEDLNIR